MLKTQLFLALDELMSGQFPATSELGGLPNHTHKPRKPVPLGTMLKNISECNAGVMFCNDVIQNPEKQSRKKHSKEKTSLPDG